MTPPPSVLSFVDSHTGGEPTRVITDGFPHLGGGDVQDQRAALERQYMDFAQTIVAEPRGTEAMVAAVCVPTTNPDAVTGVIFFDRGSTLGMCGHGTIGLIATLAHLGQTTPGLHLIETPVGPITAELHANGTVSLENVNSHRIIGGLTVDVADIGTVTGDIAWGGNMFFLVTSPSIDLAQPRLALVALSAQILSAVHGAGYTDVDHIEIFGPATAIGADSKNFVLCPNGTFDRSPCGTGTSAKLACLAADDKLREGQTWVQESITGSVFSAAYRWANDEQTEITPIITGAAEVTAQGQLFVRPPRRSDDGINGDNR